MESDLCVILERSEESRSFSIDAAFKSRHERFSARLLIGFSAQSFRIRDSSLRSRMTQHKNRIPLVFFALPSREGVVSWLRRAYALMRLTTGSADHKVLRAYASSPLIRFRRYPR